jgi:hypothetical protein
MSSASEGIDDDVIVLTEADVVDPPQAGAHEASRSAERELHHDGPQDGALQDYTLHDRAKDEDAGDLTSSTHGSLVGEAGSDTMPDPGVAADSSSDAVATEGGTVSGRDFMSGRHTTTENDTETEDDAATGDAVTGDAVTGDTVTSHTVTHDEAVSGDTLTGGETLAGDTATDRGASLRGDQPGSGSARQAGSGAFAMPGADPTGATPADTDPADATPANPDLASPDLADADLADPGPGDAELGGADPARTDPELGSPQPRTTPVTEPGGASAAAAATRASESWPEIQAMFVDDPRMAVEHAAEVTGAALSGLVAAAKDKDQSLRQEWQADGTGTEELRTSLQHYRELANRLTALSAEL